MIKLDEETTKREVYDSYENDSEYKESVNKFVKLIETKPDFLEIEETETAMETRVADICYTKGFHDGMQHILKAMAGQRVISL